MADTPDSRRVVSATEFVAQLRADQNMLNFSNCIIEGDVELRSVRFSHPLTIRNTLFKGHVDAVDARFERSVEMSQCRFEGGMNLRGARIDGDLMFVRSEFLAPSTEYGWAFFPGIQVAGQLNLNGAEFHGDLDLGNAIINGDLQGTPYDKPLRIKGDARLGGIRIDGQLLWNNVQIGGQFNLQGGDIRNGMFCRSAPGNPPVHIGDSLYLASALIEVECDVSGAIIEGGINFHDAAIKGNVVCSSRDKFPMRIGHANLEISAAYLAGANVSGRIDFNGADVLGDLNMNASKITGRVDLKGTHVHGNVNLKSAQIDGGVYATPINPFEPAEAETPTENVPDPKANTPPPPPTPPKVKEPQRTVFEGEVRMDNAKIRVSVEMSGAQFNGGFYVLDALIEGTLRLDCQMKECRTVIGREVKKDGKTEVYGGTLHLAGTQITSIVQLNGLHVMGDFYMAGTCLKGGVLAGPDPEGRPLLIGKSGYFGSVSIGVIAELFAVQVGNMLDLRDSVIEGNLELSSRKELQTNIGGSLLLGGVTISGYLGLRGVKVGGDCSLVGAEIARGLNANAMTGKPFTVVGHAMFNSVKLGVNLEMSGAQLQSTLNLQNADISGSLEANSYDKDHPTKIGSTINLRGAMIRAQANFDGATLVGDLLAPEAQIKGGLSVCSLPSQRASVGGKLSLIGMESAKVVLHGTKIVGMLDLRDAEITGSVSMRPVHDFAFEADAVQFPGAKVSKVECRGVTIRGDLDFQNAEITDGIECLPEGKLSADVHGHAIFIDCYTARLEIDGNSFRKSVQLNLAKVGELKFANALPRDGVPIDADGLEYQKIVLPDNAYRAFLKRLEPFQKSSYVFLENWLRNRGQDDLAKDVYIAMSWRNICTLPKPADAVNPVRRFFQRVRNWTVWSVAGTFGLFLHATIGFGVRSHRLLGIWLLLVWLSASIFTNPESVRPVTARYAVVDPALIPAETREWSSRDAWIMAVQMNLPMVPLITGEERRPSDNQIEYKGYAWYTTYESYAFCISLLSYLLVPLFIAGITGFLKKQK